MERVGQRIVMIAVMVLVGFRKLVEGMPYRVGGGGLYLAIQTSSGNADIQQAGAYTLNSIAAVVLGGTSLLGGVGSAVGSLIGAGILRVISFYFRILDIDPLLQPLIEGVVLLVAVSFGAIRTLRVKNKLDLFR